MNMFVHLNVHSIYSIGRSVLYIREALTWAVAQGVSTMALTDLGTLGGAIRFQCQARHKGIRPIIGCEFTWPLHAHSIPGCRARLILLVRNLDGYANLIRLLSQSRAGYMLPDLPMGSCDGLLAIWRPTPNLIHRLTTSDLKRELNCLSCYFASQNLHASLYVGMPEPVHKIAVLAEKTGLPLVAVPDVRCVKPADTASLDLLQRLCGERSRTQPPSTGCHLRTYDEMSNLFIAYPEALANTTRIAEQCDFQIAAQEPLLSGQPLFEEKAWDKLRSRAMYAMMKKYRVKRQWTHADQLVIKRFHDELHMIENEGKQAIFLLLDEIQRFAFEHRLARNVCACSLFNASIVAYALDLTGVDPLRHELIAVDFLTRLFGAINLATGEQSAKLLVQHLSETHGEWHVSWLARYGHRPLDQLIRKISGWLHVAPKTQETLLALHKYIAGAHEDPSMEWDWIEQQDEIRTLMEKDETCRDLANHLRLLSGCFEQSSRHPGQFVVTTAVNPACPAMPCLPMRHDHCEYDARSMSFLNSVYFQVNEDHCVQVLLDRIPQGQTICVEEGQLTDALIQQQHIDLLEIFVHNRWAAPEDDAFVRDILRRAKPCSRDELAAVIGLTLHNMTKQLERYIKYEPVGNIHSAVDKVLEPTRGLLLYREQVMHLAHILAGIDYKEGIDLTRAIGHRDVEHLKKWRTRFVSGCANTDSMGQEQAGAFFDNVLSKNIVISKAALLGSANLLAEAAWVCWDSVETGGLDQPQDRTMKD